MPVVNMLEAKNTLSRLVDSVESGAEPEIIIARNVVRSFSTVLTMRA